MGGGWAGGVGGGIDEREERRVAFERSRVEGRRGVTDQGVKQNTTEYKHKIRIFYSGLNHDYHGI